MHIYFLVTFFLFLIDQVSKYWVLYVLRLEKVRSLEVYEPYITFKFAWNKGINFGLFSSNETYAKWILIFMSLSICVIITFYAFKGLTTNFERIMAGFVLGGAMGNVCDRIFHGAVVDFLNISCCGIVNRYSFNLADVAIFLGIFGIIFFSAKKV